MARRVPWQSLEADFYIDPDVFALDMNVVFGRHWIFGATEAEIPGQGNRRWDDPGVLLGPDNRCRPGCLTNRPTAICLTRDTESAPVQPRFT